MSKFYVTCSWSQCPHLSEEDQESMMRSLPPHQRDARSKGIPSMGSGAIYPVIESDFVISPMKTPPYWKYAYGMDVGWQFTAAAFGAYDPENDILYITSDYKRSQTEPTIHAQAISLRARGEKKPGVIDPASCASSQIDGRKLIDIYKGLGLNLREADNTVEAGIYEVWNRLSTGRLKVFSSCSSLLEEYRMYRRDEKGKIIKSNDHVMDALRYLCSSGISIAKQDITTVKKSTLNRIAGSWMSR